MDSAASNTENPIYGENHSWWSNDVESCDYFKGQEPTSNVVAIVCMTLFSIVDSHLNIKFISYYIYYTNIIITRGALSTDQNTCTILVTYSKYLRYHIYTYLATNSVVTLHAVAEMCTRTRLIRCNCRMNLWKQKKWCNFNSHWFIESNWVESVINAVQSMILWYNNYSKILKVVCTCIC